MMKKCIRCQQEIIAGDWTEELRRQEDALGTESLMEAQQLLVMSLICEECYECE